MALKVAIIDRGIEVTHKRLKNAVCTGVTINQKSKDEHELIEGKYDEDDDGHGTAVGSIIHKINPGVELVSVKLSSENDVITDELLAKGIAYCAGRDDIQLINISMGIPSKNPCQLMKKAVDKALANGKLIIAATFPFQDRKCYPASFSKVLGVGSGLVKSKFDYRFVGPGDTDILAKGTTQRVAWKNNSFKISAGTSYATAHFCGLISTKLSSGQSMTYDQLIEKIIADSNEEVEELSYLKNFEINVGGNLKTDTTDPDLEEFKPFSKVSFAKKVAVFPYHEKENKTVIENTSLDITLCIDYPRSFGKVNGFNVNQSKLNGNLIKRKPSESDFDLFDTLIVGYYMDQLFDANIIFGNKLIRDCIIRNKNIITWDKYVLKYAQKSVKQCNLDYSGKIWSPHLSYADFNRIVKLKDLPIIEKPVLGVVGTGSKQGKMTAQLVIKSILQSAGYVVSHLSTEPQGVVLGANFSFPFGYKSTVELMPKDWPLFIDTTIRAIQAANNPDIIISGTQGGLVPRAPVNPNFNFLFSALNYMSSVRPDILICAINPTDPVELIKKNVQTLQLYVNCELIFYVITPWFRDFMKINNQLVSNYSILEKAELKQKIKEYSEVLEVPVIDVMDPSNGEFILSAIQNALA